MKNCTTNGPWSLNGVTCPADCKEAQTLVTNSTSILAQLTDVIEQRKDALPTESYTSQLLEGGVEAIAAKILEEAGEVVEAAREADSSGDEKDRQHLVREAADLVFHLLVMLGYHDIRFSRVETELARRFGISGLEEKAARTASD